MYDFFSQTAETQKGLIENAALKMKMTPAIIEKDLWVVLTLKALFSKGTPNIFLFKGGTSLSKAYQIIERFSEDIDVTIDRASLSDKFSMDYFSGLSRNQVNKALDELNTKAIDQIYRFLPLLQEEINILSGVETTIKPMTEDPFSIEVFYPSRFEDEYRYIKPRILLEFGIRGDNFPAEEKIITPYLHQNVEQLNTFQTSVNVLSPIRTFFEKLTLLHAEHNRPSEKATPERLSRHYYDVYQLASHGFLESALREMPLLKTVIAHKMTFFASSWAAYDRILKEGIRLFPVESRLKEIEEDYKKMEPMFFNNVQVPALQEILLKLNEIETSINNSILV